MYRLLAAFINSFATFPLTQVTPYGGGWSHPHGAVPRSRMLRSRVSDRGLNQSSDLSALAPCNDLTHLAGHKISLLDPSIRHI